MQEQVEKLGQDWAGAEQRGDADFLGRTLTDDFVGIGPAGFMLTKDQWLGRYQSDSLRNESFALNDVTVHVYGDAAVITGRQVQQTQYRDPRSGQFQDSSGEFRTRLIAVRQGDRWLISGWQASGPIPNIPQGRA